MKPVACILLLLLTISQLNCTNSRWVVTDTEAVDNREEPQILSSSWAMVTGVEPTPDHPILEVDFVEVRELEFVQRVLVERTVQPYSPRWGFTLLGTVGASIAIFAANTDGFISEPSVTQSYALNATGAILLTLAFTNMKPVGEAIRTGESRFLRRSGTIVLPDTIRAPAGREFSTSVSVHWEGSVLMQEDSVETSNGSLAINLASLFEGHEVDGESPGEIEVHIEYQDESRSFNLPVERVLQPMLQVEAPITALRDTPLFDSDNILAELQSGSILPLEPVLEERWFQVQFGGSSLYVSKNEATVRWLPAAGNNDGQSVVTIEEVPFGEIDVESFIPVLRNASSNDFAFIISNHENNQIGQRRYLDRDHLLIRRYFRDAFGLPQNRIQALDAGRQAAIDAYNLMAPEESETLFLFLGGYAYLQEEEGETELGLVHLSSQGEIYRIPLEELLEPFLSGRAERLILFADLEFNHPFNPSAGQRSGGSPWAQLNRVLTTSVPNSALIAASGTGQSSGVYASERFENMHHHIFTYFLARAWQERQTQLHEIVRYLERQVDYTSRRLHDRSQEVQAFGNMTINLAN
ncbi:MAG: hypothetical protein WDZ29_04300 [Balneolaceae bacterium]